MAAKLPLTMKVKAVRRGPIALEVDAVVSDADGDSVSSESLTMHPKSSLAQASGILQNHVDVLAKGMHKHGAAVLPESNDKQTDRDIEEADSAFVGHEFTGSVVI
jgi:hypothetical protein